jgi:sigma-B regulation protein RsbU (phosphoserine phosphatase)
VYKLAVLPPAGAAAAFEHLLDAEALVIGRATSADLVLEDPFLSRQHSRLFRRGERLFVEDLGSRNGTLVNGRPIAGPTELRLGDVIQISGSTLTLRRADGLEGPEAAIAAGAAAGTGTDGLGTLAGLVGNGGNDGNSGLDPFAADTAEAGEDMSRTVYRSAAELLKITAEPLPAPGSAGAPQAPGAQEAPPAPAIVALRRQAERLKILNEVHQALSSSISLESLLELILDRTFDYLKPEQGVIYLKRPSGELVRAASRAVGSGRDELLASRSLAREVAGKGLAALVLDAQTDVRFAGAQSIMMSGVRSLLAAPLLTRDGTLGMIVLGSKLAVREFTEEDMELLACLASAAALAIRNLALAEEAAERRRLAEELSLARRIQLALLPQSLPDLPGYQLHGGNTPSRGVSGDYFAVMPREGAGSKGAVTAAGTEKPPSECVLLIADVSGKGMAASLLTASLEAFAAGPIEDGLGPDEICAKLSRLLYRRTPPEKYATAYVAVLTTATGAVRYTNAGHNPPLVLRSTGQVEELPATGVPIALLAGAEYQAAETHLAPGDTLVLYTDGIVEAANPEDEEYGQDRLAALCARHCQAGCADLAAALERDLDAFVDGTPFGDDRTLVLVRRMSGAAQSQ